MPDQLQDDDLIAALEREAGLEPGLLRRLLALEAEFPDLNMRGARRDLYRSLAAILDAEADRMAKQ